MCTTRDIHNYNSENILPIDPFLLQNFKCHLSISFYSFIGLMLFFFPVSFTQKHEVKQVYVRSTARVYEIYHSADDKGDNEYLCTVRCGVAAKTEELLQETDGEGSLSTSSSSPNRSSCEGHFRSGSGGSTNEDDWVDVKVQNPSMLDSRDTCLSKKDESCMERGNQVLLSSVDLCNRSVKSCYVW